jgi:hypothetical protein
LGAALIFDAVQTVELFLHQALAAYQEISINYLILNSSYLKGSFLVAFSILNFM